MVVATALGGLFAFRWWGSDERIIETRLHELAAALPPVSGGELTTVSRLAQLRTHFAPDVQVRFGEQQISSRETLLALLARWEVPADISVEFVDVGVSVGAERSTAQVNLTAKISSRDARTGALAVDAREAVLAMSRVDNVWVIEAVDGTATLRRP
jgi:hypothetical protein